MVIANFYAFALTRQYGWSRLHGYNKIHLGIISRDLSRFGLDHIDTHINYIKR